MIRHREDFERVCTAGNELRKFWLRKTCKPVQLLFFSSVFLSLDLSRSLSRSAPSCPLSHAPTCTLEPQVLSVLMVQKSPSDPPKFYRGLNMEVSPWGPCCCCYCCCVCSLAAWGTTHAGVYAHRLPLLRAQRHWYSLGDRPLTAPPGAPRLTPLMPPLPTAHTTTHHTDRPCLLPCTALEDGGRPKHA